MGADTRHLIQDSSSYKSPEGCTHSYQLWHYQDSTQETACPEALAGRPPTASSTGLDQPYSTYWSKCILQASLHFHRFLLLVCRPILFTGKQQQHLCIYTVVKVLLFQGSVLKQRRRHMLRKDTECLPLEAGVGGGRGTVQSRELGPSLWPPFLSRPPDLWLWVIRGQISNLLSKGSGKFSSLPCIYTFPVSSLQNKMYI